MYEANGSLIENERKGDGWPTNASQIKAIPFHRLN